MANPWRFWGAYGGYTDAQSGLVKLGARYYFPALARWTQQDPKVQPFDPVQANRYAYAGCNPANNVDPSGTNIDVEGYIKACTETGLEKGIVGGIGGAIAGAYVGGVAGGPIGAIGGAFQGATKGFWGGAAYGCLEGVVEKALN